MKVLLSKREINEITNILKNERNVRGWEYNEEARTRVIILHEKFISLSKKVALPSAKK